MININLLNPKSRVDVLRNSPPAPPASPALRPPDEPIATPTPTPTSSDRFSASSWQGIVLINIGAVVVIVTMIMLLPSNMPLIGGIPRPAKIALSRFFDMIF